MQSRGNVEKRLSELKYNFLIPRNYQAKLIDEQLKRIKELPGSNFTTKQKNALRKVEKENQK